jgi:DNA-binding transcriptional ArsR family regulator
LRRIYLVGYIPDVATSFQVLADPTRRRILDLLLERSLPVGELAGQLGLTQPGASKHLRVLREAGLVAARQDAQRRWYELRPGPLTEIDAWLQPYRRLWEARLDALERHLDVMPDEDVLPDETDEPEGTAP